MSDLRSCKTCGSQLPATDEYFHRHPRGFLGLSNVCKPCACARAKASKEARKNTPEFQARVLADAKLYQQRHPEKVTAYRKNRYQQQRNVLNAKRRARYYANLDAERQRMRNWRKANPDRVRAAVKLRGLRLKAGGSFTQAEWQQKLADSGRVCHWCQKPIQGRPIADHLIPISRGGNNTIDNIVPACVPCNASKHAAMPHEFVDRFKSPATP